MVTHKFPPVPGFFSIVFGALLSMLLGAVLACFHLMATPVQVLAADPKEPEAGKVYFVRTAKGGDWERKVAQLKNSNTGLVVRFSDAELSGWAGKLFEQFMLERDKNPDGREARAKEAGSMASARIAGEQVQAGIVLHRRGALVAETFVLQARGGFSRGPFGWRFDPDEVYVGSLPLHKLPAVGLLLRTSMQSWKNELRDADSITIEKGVLAVQMP
jgi:hypothetical protein